MSSSPTLERLRIDAVAHENSVLRSEMLSFWSREPEVPTAVAGRAIEAIESFGMTEAFRYVHQIRDLPHNESSWNWLIDQLEACRNAAKRGPGIRSKPTLESHLAGWFSEGPTEWLKRDIDRFIEVTPGSAKLRGHLDDSSMGPAFNEAWSRTQISQLDAAGRLAALEERINRTAKVDDFAHDLVSEIKMLAGEIARNDDLNDATLASWARAALDDSDDITAGYRGGAALLVMTASKGALKLPLDSVLGLLALDWDWTNELVQDALIAAADQEMMEGVIDRFSDLEWFERLYVSTAIERRRFSGLQPHLIRLLNEVPDDEELSIVTSLGQGAVWHGDEASIEAARELSRTIPDSGDGSSLHDALWLHEVLVNGLIGERLARAERMLEDWKRIEARMKAFESLAPSPSPKVIDTHIRATQKVARNDPCPCGSGKKYKKCCG